MNILLEQSTKETLEKNARAGAVITICKECGEMGAVPITEAFAKEARKRLSAKFGVDLSNPDANGVYETCSLTFHKCSEHAFLILGDKMP